MTHDTGVDLFWLPLGAGGHVVRWNGRVYEAVSARLHGRPVTDLYHSALKVSLAGEWWVVEMTPVWAAAETDRGVVAQGAVGTRWAGRSRWFRYEVHSSRGGSIHDVAEAVASPVRITSDETVCRQLLSVLPSVPFPVWGRDELGTGEMWNSNSVIAWALARSGIPTAGVLPPRGGTAPGWRAGVVMAARQLGQGAVCPPLRPV
jgi:hypothetical protein